MSVILSRISPQRKPVIRPRKVHLADLLRQYRDQRYSLRDRADLDEPLDPEFEAALESFLDRFIESNWDTKARRAAGEGVRWTLRRAGRDRALKAFGFSPGRIAEKIFDEEIAVVVDLLNSGGILPLKRLGLIPRKIDLPISTDTKMYPWLYDVRDLIEQIMSDPQCPQDNPGAALQFLKRSLWERPAAREKRKSASTP